MYVNPFNKFKFFSFHGSVFQTTDGVHANCDM